MVKHLTDKALLVLLSSLLFSEVVAECQLGYSPVCTQSFVGSTNKTGMKSICPASYNTTSENVVRQEECSCLPTRAVEQDLADGMSPLGSQHKECLMVPAAMLPMDDLDVGNITEMMDMWGIEGAVQNMTTDAAKHDELMAALKEAMKKEMKHSKILQERTATKFIRSTKISRKIGGNYRMMKCLQNATKSVTSTWATSRRKRQSPSEPFQDTCMALTGFLSPCPSECNETDAYRRIDGCCNNLNQKDLGSAHNAFARFLTPVYEDNVEIPRGGLSSSSLPSPRDVSNIVHKTREIVGNKDASLMVMQFGQFLDHDITLTPEPESECCDDSLDLDVCFNINSGENCLPFSRSDAICNQHGRREQINALTAYIDGSNIYGSDLSVSEGLRTKFGGELRLNGIGPTLPTREEAGFESGHGQDPEDLVGGDIRAIEQPGLASMHSLFLNEHNRIARILKGKVPELVDEDLYQITKQIVGAELQNIVYSEFLPVVLGEEAMVKFNLKLTEDVSGESVYDPKVVPDIRNEFATAAFRFGHSLIPNHILPDIRTIRTKSIACPVRENFFKFDDFIYGSDLSGKAWQNMIVGMTNQKSPSMDAAVNRVVLDFLFCGSNCGLPGGFGQDLAARNIQRGRDHGLPSYSKYREFCHLSALTNWANRPSEISEQDWNNFQKVYSSVLDIDLFVGGLAEVGSGDGLVGPTFGCIIGKQFEVLMKGDRFFFTHKSSGAQNEKGLSLNTKLSIRSRTLGDIICDNTETSGIAKNVMRVTSNKDTIPCSTRMGLDFDAIVKDLTVTGNVEIHSKTFPGVLITGGTGALTSTELFLPESGKTCSLQSLPDNRYYHSLDNLAGHIILCGGQYTNTRTSCLEFLPDSSTGSWAHYATLAQRRYYHTTFISQEGELMLLGGGVSPGTTEIVGEGVKYNLQQDTYSACSIPDQSSTILTGGYNSGWHSSVVRYDYQGYVENLPDLATARIAHGCGYYEDNGDKVLVVVGGYGNAGRLSSTELLTPGAKAWSTGESLPRTLSHLTSVNMDGFILLIGGYDGSNNRGEVLKFNGTWTEVGRMKNARRGAAATKIGIPREGGLLDISACV